MNDISCNIFVSSWEFFGNIKSNLLSEPPYTSYFLANSPPLLFSHIFNFSRTTLQFEEALTTEKMKLSLPDDQPLTKEDCDFLQSICCQVLPGQNKTVNLSGLLTLDKIQGYAIVLKLIEGKN